MPLTPVTNIVVAGLGGQGVLLASDILAQAAFRAGRDVKKAEVHGMSQRGGSVSSDIRFGEQVLSPMVPLGEADFLLVLASDQVEINRHRLRAEGVLIEPITAAIELPDSKCLNIALLGFLSQRLDLPQECWEQALRAQLPAKIFAMNQQAFALGRRAG